MDRLPSPMDDTGRSAGTERASATPKTVVSLDALKDAARAGQGRAAGTGRATRSLREVQEWMLGAIEGPEPNTRDAAAVLTDGPKLSARERLEIYRYGYHARLAECLLDDYPTLGGTLGERAFDALCREYVEHHPSTSPNLNAFGRHMETFLRTAELGEHAPLRAFLVELSRLEWALVEMIHAPSSLPFDLSALQAIPPEAWGDVRLARGTTVRLLRFDHPVNAYFQACRTRDERPPVPGPSPSATVVYRRGFTLWRMDLTPAMTRVLAALLAERPIGEALAQMEVDETDPSALAEAERSVMVWFREWVQSGFFQGVVQ